MSLFERSKKRTVYVILPNWHKVDAPAENGDFNNQFEIQCAALYNKFEPFFKQKAQQSHQQLIKALEKVADVRILEEAGNIPEHHDSVFVQDIGWMNYLAFIDKDGSLIPIKGTSTFFKAKMAKPSRMGEPQAVVDNLRSKGWLGDHIVEMKNTAEGGDTPVKTTPLKATSVTASVGQRNTQAGVAEFAEKTGLPYYIYELDENSGAFHADVATRILADGTIIACPEAFKGGRSGDEFKRFIREQAEYDVNTDDEIETYIQKHCIITSLSDMQAYGINLLELYDENRDRHLFVPYETKEERQTLITALKAFGATDEELLCLPSLVSDEYMAALEKTGCTIHKINMLPFIMAGGGVHCTTKTVYPRYDNKPRALPTSISPMVTIQIGVKDNETPDITLTDVNGSLEIIISQNCDANNIPENIRTFLQTVTDKPILNNSDLFSTIKIRNDVGVQENVTIPEPLFNNSPSLQINVRGVEKAETIVHLLFQVLGNQGSKLNVEALEEQNAIVFFNGAMKVQNACYR